MKKEGGEKHLRIEGGRVTRKRSRWEERREEEKGKKGRRKEGERRETRATQEAFPPRLLA